MILRIIILSVLLVGCRAYPKKNLDLYDVKLQDYYNGKGNINPDATCFHKKVRKVKKMKVQKFKKRSTPKEHDTINYND